MRVLFSSVSVATALAAGLISSAQASPIYPEPSTSGRTENLAIRSSAGLWGSAVIDGYRTIDGKNFYHDDASPKLGNGSGPTLSNGAGPLGFFASESNDARLPFSNSSGSLSSNRGSMGSAGSFGGGGNSVSPGFVGPQSGFGAGGSSPLKGLNPLNSAYATLTADHGGFPEISEGGGGKAEVSSTPLPPAWTLMLLGLAGFGFVARRLSKNEKVFTAA